MSATPADSARPLLPLLLGALLLLAGSLWLNTRNNDFPFFYHPDEPDKVDQLITGKWNFHHPLLMLGAAELAKDALHISPHEQPLVILGRWCSATFAAIGMLGFALLAWRVRGLAAFWIVGLLLVTQHQVFELAHYFKEDTALFFAVALAFLAIHVHYTRPRFSSALLAGAACGLCLSAKYLGAGMLIPAAVVFIAGQRAKRISGIQWLWFALPFVAVAAAVNFPVFSRIDIFTHSFDRETALVAEGGRAYTGGQVAIFYYIHSFIANTTPLVWVLVIVELLAVCKRRDLFDWLMVIFPFAFTLLLSCSNKTNDRYYLPATAGFYYLAGLGAIDLPTLLAPKWAARLRPALVAALALIVNLLYLAPYAIAFAHDDRREMLAWIRANIPADAAIAGEDRADLPYFHRPERLAVQPLLPQRILQVKYAADLGATPSAVASQGIDYIVISESDYGLFFRKAAGAHLSAPLRQKRAFYETLFRDFQPVWERPRGTGIYLHPGLRIYHLTAKKQA